MKPARKSALRLKAERLVADAIRLHGRRRVEALVAAVVRGGGK